MNNNPIGILDSGLGGLTVWKEIVTLLPQESTIYIADSLNAPYGARSSEQIYTLAKRLINFLIEKKVKVIVVACNTITVSCLDRLRADYPNIPIIGTVPVVKTAVAVTKNKRIGILSTTYTAKSKYQKELIQKFALDCQVFNHGTDELVPFVEQAELTGKRVGEVLKKILEPLQAEKIDTLALGCTHFPFLRDQMQDILGKDVTILDSGAAIARQVQRVVENNQIQAGGNKVDYSFYTTGKKEIAKKLLAATINWREIPAFLEVTL